jgi:hypothetical protein
MTGMRKWLTDHRRMVALVIVAVVWGTVIIVSLIWSRPLDEVLTKAAMWAIYMGVLWYMQMRRKNKTQSRLDSQDGMLAYVRYPDSPAGSLSSIWNQGVVTFDGPAGMTFQPSVYETLEPSGRPTTFTSIQAESTEPRKIGWSEHKYMPHQGFQLIRLVTDKGDLEVAATPASLRKILDAAQQENEADPNPSDNRSQHAP